MHSATRITHTTSSGTFTGTIIEIVNGWIIAEFSRFRDVMAGPIGAPAWEHYISAEAARCHALDIPWDPGNDSDFGSRLSSRWHI